MELGCDVNSVDKYGDSLLHYAVNLENKSFENWLLTVKNFDREVKNNEGETPY